VRACSELSELLAKRLAEWQRNNPETAPAAIDLWNGDPLDVRRAAHEAVRTALREGARPRRLGLAFVAVVADLSYEVDWRDQFSFWPLLNKQLDADPFDLKDSTRRNECAHAFRSCADQFGLLVPEGSFAQSFPLMALCLSHAVLPRSAHRHVAQLLEEVPEGADLVQYARARLAPKYLVGLLEHSGLRRRLDRLVSDDSLDAGVLRRIRVDIDADDGARRALQRARDTRAGRRSARRFNLGIDLGPPARLAVTLGPIDDGEVKSEAVVRLMGDFAAVSFVTADRGAPLTEPEYLVNARARQLRIPLRLPAAATIEITPRIQPCPSSDVEEVEAYFRPSLVLSMPIVFRQSSDGSFIHPLREGQVRRGDVLAVVSAESAPTVPPGFGKPQSVEGTQWVVCSGSCDAAVAAALGLSMTNHTRLQPAFAAPLSVARDACRYAVGDIPFFWMRGAEAGASFLLQRSGRTTLLPATRIGDLALIQVQPNDLQEPAELVALGASGEELSRLALSAISPSETEVEPWAVRLCPQGAGATHLATQVCWIDAWVVNEQPLYVRLQSPTGQRVEAQFGPLQYTKREASMRALGALVTRLREETGAEKVEGPVQLFAWLEGSTSSPRLFAEAHDLPPAIGVTVSGDDVRFELSGMQSGQLSYAVLDEWLNEQALPERSLSKHSADGLYVMRHGREARGIVWAGSGSFNRRPAWPFSGERSLQRAVQLTSCLRVLDVAALGPERARHDAEALRALLVLQCERALVRVLCGTAWLLEEASTVANPSQTLARLAPLTSFGLGDIGELASGLAAFRGTEEPQIASNAKQRTRPTGARQLLDIFLEEVLEHVEREGEHARNLLLLFRRRAAAPPSSDLPTLSWAYRTPRVARFVRLVDLSTKRAAESRADE
jgi:hypothetical protein